MKKYINTVLLALFSVPCFASMNLARLRFHKSIETLKTIELIISKGEKGAYLRFGDGDINLAFGEHDSFQDANNNLKREMQEAFALKGRNVLKTLPINCKELGTLEPGMGFGMHEIPYDKAVRWLNKVQSLWPEPITDVYSTAALHHASTQFPEECIKFLKFLKQYPCILVGNQHIPKEMRNLLFGENCLFVPTPDKQSYNSIDSIEQETLHAAEQIEGYKVIITSMGCSGRALQKRLWYKIDNAFLFDFGSLMDALCGWETRVWMAYAHFNRKTFLKLYNQVQR